MRRACRYRRRSRASRLASGCAQRTPSARTERYVMTQTMIINASEPTALGSRNRLENGPIYDKLRSERGLARVLGCFCAAMVLLAGWCGVAVYGDDRRSARPDSPERQQRRCVAKPKPRRHRRDDCCHRRADAMADAFASAGLHAGAVPRSRRFILNDDHYRLGNRAIRLLHQPSGQRRLFCFARRQL